MSAGQHTTMDERVCSDFERAVEGRMLHCEDGLKREVSDEEGGCWE